MRWLRGKKNRSRMTLLTPRNKELPLIPPFLILSQVVVVAMPTSPFPSIAQHHSKALITRSLSPHHSQNRRVIPLRLKRRSLRKPVIRSLSIHSQPPTSLKITAIRSPSPYSIRAQSSKTNRQGLASALDWELRQARQLTRRQLSVRQMSPSLTFSTHLPAMITNLQKRTKISKLSTNNKTPSRLRQSYSFSMSRRKNQTKNPF